ncbi:MAG: 5'-methylthioadenosine/S-adenosylhomocysteine nucleosidase, partial [Dongiaceae bacterium]
MRRVLSLALVALCASLMGRIAYADDAAPRDPTPRTAVISAFQPEWVALQGRLKDRKDQVINGTTFATGTIEGKPVVLFLSGISMVNASMTTQLSLDRFNIKQIVFSGIAGGVDPNLSIGDVVVPAQWSEYLESVIAREENGKYTLPSYAEKTLANFHMMFPQPIQIAKGNDEVEKREWFPADAQLLAIARKTAQQAPLQKCTADQKCLTHQPKIVVGGNGVSGQAFVDNKIFREYVRSTFHAEVLDMDSAA